MRELVLLLSWVGLPKDLLTDQGMPFISANILYVLAIAGKADVDLRVPAPKRWIH